MEKKESEACSWEEAALEFDQRLCNIWKRMEDLDSEDEFDEALNELDILEDEMESGRWNWMRQKLKKRKKIQKMQKMEGHTLTK
ncbi:unnamed protein product [Blepharisma stoltei]|uniref:Uncharacterized protein n=1 Tax=Blepharisma stoltei TaxID=1481888 RepID=A0AAU9IDP5_9CILI|nr:unnamed protein product [Blepharisma stoltei]